MSPNPAAALAQNFQSAAIKVERFVFTVSPLRDGKQYSLVGYLYYHGSYKNRPLQICIHGGTYHHGYWDFPRINNQDYSYARFMANAKHAVLALDMLGGGESDVPEGDLLNLESAATAVLQVIQNMRSGNNPARYAFKKVALVGHSLGSAIAIKAQGMAASMPGKAGADALVTTGLGHEPHFLPISMDFMLTASQHPYFSFTPEMRASLFYAENEADPEVIAYDNQTFSSGRISRGLLHTAMVLAFDEMESQVGDVRGPVLVQFGENDALFPATYAPQEAVYWRNASEVLVQTLPNVGHDFNTHIDNRAGWMLIHDFLDPILDKK